MKNLVLGSSLLAALASQTTGCVIEETDDFATITADWSFRSVNGSGQLSPENTCPPNHPTVALHSQELDANDNPIGDEVIDLFDCVDGSNFTDELIPGVYEAFIRVSDDSLANEYARSLPVILDVTVADQTFKADIVDNGGYFKVAWNLRDEVTNAPLTCPDVAGLDGVEIISTIAGAGDGVTDIFDCEVGADFSAPVMEGTYVVTVNALDTAGGALNAAPIELNNKVMRNRNQVTDLGTVTIPVP